MSHRFSILSVGKDAEVLSARNRGLQDRGHVVVPAQNRHKAILLSGDRHFDLMVLCWSFGQEANSLAADLSTVCPDVPVLILKPPSQLGGSLDCFSELEEVERILWVAPKRRGSEGCPVKAWEPAQLASARSQEPSTRPAFVELPQHIYKDAPKSHLPLEQAVREHRRLISEWREAHGQWVA
jgi:hypothetical protein